MCFHFSPATAPLTIVTMNNSSFFSLTQSHTNQTGTSTDVTDNMAFLLVNMQLILFLLLWWVLEQAVKCVVKRILRRYFGQRHWALEEAIAWTATKLIQFTALAIITTVIQLLGWHA